MNQASLHANLCNRLFDAIVQDEVDISALGSRIVLSNSFLGSDWFMQQLFQDSMAIVLHFGKRSLFITFTANSGWNEIQVKLLPYQILLDHLGLID